MVSEEENRIFIATFFNAKNKKLCGLIDKLNSKNHPGLKPVPVEKIHITWKFIGKIAPTENKKIFNIIKEHSYMLKNISIEFGKLEIWPNSRNPRLLAIIPVKYNNKFKDYFKHLDENLYKALKIKKEKKEFVPHITVARIKNNIKNINKFKKADFEPIKLKIKHIQVTESINIPQGVLYKILFSEEI